MILGIYCTIKRQAIVMLADIFCLMPMQILAKPLNLTSFHKISKFQIVFNNLQHFQHQCIAEDNFEVNGACLLTKISLALWHYIGVPNLAEIIPIEPDTGNAGEGKCNRSFIAFWGTSCSFFKNKLNHEDHHQHH
jgi:hypothetical protein